MMDDEKKEEVINEEVKIKRAEILTIHVSIIACGRNHVIILGRATAPLMQCFAFGTGRFGELGLGEEGLQHQIVLEFLCNVVLRVFNAFSATSLFTSSNSSTE